MDRISFLKYELIAAPDGHDLMQDFTFEWSQGLSNYRKMEIIRKLLNKCFVDAFGSEQYFVANDILFGKWRLLCRGFPVATLIVPHARLVSVKADSINYRWNGMNRRKIAEILDRLVSDYERNLLPESYEVHAVDDISSILWGSEISNNYNDRLRGIISHNPGMDAGQRFSIN